MTGERDRGSFLIGVAGAGIRRALDVGPGGGPDLADCPPLALTARACFVTLTTSAQGLRGCRGSLEPRRALGLDVWHNAQASACADPRFPALQRAELGELSIEIAVLGPLETVHAMSEAELQAQLVPLRDGLVLRWRAHRATFLPKVWEHLPEPRDFLAALRQKAGLPPDFWSPELVIERYKTEVLSGAMRAAA